MTALAAETRDELLSLAFERFEHAAEGMRGRHAALLANVERLERDLMDAHRRLEAVLDAVADGVAVVTPEGRILRTNVAFQRMGLGGPEAALDDAELRRLVRDADAGGTARLKKESGDGVRDLVVALVPVGDRGGSAVLTVRDVTDIRREEQEGGRRRRLEALGRMAAEIAHEVRNPLGSIRLFAGLLRDDLAGRDADREMADQIIAATAGLEATVANLLAFAVPSRGARAEFDLAALAREVCALFTPSCALRNVRLSGPGAATSHSIVGEPEGLRQVLLNLLGNALNATPENGEIRVGVDGGTPGAALWVADDGHGILPEDLPRVFDPFFSRTRGGTGLGLSIVHRIVERHGGRIAVESRPGRGTRVKVELPAGNGADPGEVCDV